jgi:two-component system cell cycle response regulator
MHTVLLVDPSPNRDALAERLEMQGYRVLTRSDGAKGAHFALSSPPAVIIADLWMPGISGIQLCRLLRSEPATEHVPIILRGPEHNGRDRFWAERAGAIAYVGRGSMGDLVRALTSAIAAAPPQTDGFFTQLGDGELDLRERIAAQLDSALFDSVIASEIRALGVCGNFDRLFDMLSQFVVQVAGYRWLAVHTVHPTRLAVHAHPAHRQAAEEEARAALRLSADVPVVFVEDEDAADEAHGPNAQIEAITLGAEAIGGLAMGGLPSQAGAHRALDADLVRVIARELGGPIRIATLMEESNRLAMLDPLTGLLNRRAFIAAMERQIALLERHGEGFCLLLLDVDHFKTLNDQHGHATGDAVLLHLGITLPASVRRSDVVGRWGGEEFVITLTIKDPARAAARAETIRQAIANMTVRDASGLPVSVTASIGVAAAAFGDTVEQLVERADKAMYAAKSAGRNKVTVAEATPAARQAAAEITALIGQIH